MLHSVCLASIAPFTASPIASFRSLFWIRRLLLNRNKSRNKSSQINFLKVTTANSLKLDKPNWIFQNRWIGKNCLNIVWFYSVVYTATKKQKTLKTKLSKLSIFRFFYFTYFAVSLFLFLLSVFLRNTLLYFASCLLSALRVRSRQTTAKLIEEIKCDQRLLFKENTLPRTHRAQLYSYNWCILIHVHFYN